MILFCLAIGFQQVAIKSVAKAASPLAQIAIRSPIAAALVVAAARWRGNELWLAGQFRPGLVLGGASRSNSSSSRSG